MCSFIELAQQNRQELISRFDSGILLLGGGKSSAQYTTDRDLPFRQESNFFYLTGVQRPDCLAMINASTGKFTLFAPALDPSLEMWMGPLPSFEDLAKEYGADEVLDVEDLNSVLPQFSHEKMYVFPHLFPMDVLSDYEIDTELLQETIEEMRVIKKPLEIEEIRKACGFTNKAFRTVMALIRPGMKEFHVQALFEGAIMMEGSRNPSFMPICAAGKNSSTLHYVDNDKTIGEGDIILLDAGAETPSLYAADVTRVFPASGEFNDYQKDIVNLVNRMNNAAFELCKPGVPFELLHRAAQRACAEGMIELGMATGTVEELLDNHVTSYFFVHGLGHGLGLDVHEPRGYPKGVERINEPGIKYLRMRRDLKENMVITIEAGFYFAGKFMKDAFENEVVSKFLNWDKINEYMENASGVRLEDDIVITANGFDNLTQEIPKTVEEIEAFCKGARSVAKM
ncbi:hypothetical protein P9112_012994 [Eukaryota sp. TZLM1-RC]